MTSDDLLPRLIWATRGRSWGFRFLLDGGLSDPLQEYERAFRGAGDSRSVSESYDGGRVVRFIDPDGRQDEAGREIPHDFVVLGASGISSPAPREVEEFLWSVVSQAYGRVWDSPRPPNPSELGLHLT